MKYLFLLATTFSFTHTVMADELEDQLVPHLDKIYQALTVQSTATKNACEDLQTTLTQTADSKEINAKFRTLVLDWKRVQSLYVISDYDDDAIDLPHYIDVFHRGKENLDEQMQRVLSSQQAAKTALFKHSFKTVNALERVLFAQSNTTTLSERQQQLAVVITDNLCQRMSTIEQKYQTLKPAFLKKPKKAVAILLNELIESSYKLKEWRLGDAAGLSRKRSNQAENDKFIEYRLSKLSLPAMQAILDTHTHFTKKDGEFAHIIKILAEHDEIEEPLIALADARNFSRQSVEQFATLSDENLIEKEKIRPVYNTLNDLHDSYFVELIESLSDIVARILDSDGD